MVEDAAPGYFDSSSIPIPLRKLRVRVSSESLRKTGGWGADRKGAGR